MIPIYPIFILFIYFYFWNWLLGCLSYSLHMNRDARCMWRNAAAKLKGLGILPSRDLWRWGGEGKSEAMLCWDQHVSAKAWRFHNNLFQLVHSCPVTSIFDCRWSFLTLWFDTRTVQAALHLPSRAEGGRVEELLEYQTMKLRRNIELPSAHSELQEHLQLGNPVKWHFQLGSIGPLPLDFRQLLCLGVIKGRRYN